MALSYNPYWAALRRSKDLHKYLAPGAGKMLAQHDLENIGVDKDLPQHFKDYYRKWKIGPLAWIHIKPRQERFEKDEFGITQPVRNANIPVIYPEEFHFGLWGGEGIVKGFLEPPPKRHSPNYDIPQTKYWFPKLHQTVVYSEVLNKNISMHATKRGEYLVDLHQGFDAYLLENEVNEVYAKMLLNIKREILLSLVRETLWPDDPVRRKELLDRFKKHILPEEEADWHGLTLNQARSKLGATERLERELNIDVPLKHRYRQELVEQLRSGEVDDIDPALLYNDEEEGLTVGKAIKKVKKKLFK